jgi:hypothetical protein
MDKDKVIELAKQCATETTDYDLYGKPITDADVLIMGVFGDLMCRIVNKAIDKYRAELLAGSEEPVAQLHPKHWATEAGCVDWCREVLLYSSNNEGDTIRGENVRTKIYTADQLAAAVLREREECAKVCESEWAAETQRLAGIEFAKAIRERNKP